MRLFGEIAARSFRRQLTYRAAVLAGLFTNYFFGIFRIAIMAALYGSRSEVAGVDIQGGITYMVLTQAVIGYLAMFSWYDLMNSVYSGEIGSDLLKPINLFTFWMARDLGRAGVQLLLRGVLLIVLYLPFFDLAYPQNLPQWMALAAIVVLSWLVSFSWRFLVNLAAFWTPNATGFGRFVFIISWAFSGFLMPLRYLPDWAIRIANQTPFPYTLNAVMDVYIGVLQGPELVEVFFRQAFWIAALVLAGQLVLRLGVRRLVILGG
jgi:ABC-2 type transport system permease protein